MPRISSSVQSRATKPTTIDERLAAAKAHLRRAFATSERLNLRMCRRATASPDDRRRSARRRAVLCSFAYGRGSFGQECRGGLLRWFGERDFAAIRAEVWEAGRSVARADVRADPAGALAT